MTMNYSIHAHGLHQTDSDDHAARIQVKQQAEELAVVQCPAEDHREEAASRLPFCSRSATLIESHMRMLLTDDNMIQSSA